MLTSYKLDARAVLGNIGPRSWQYGPSAARSVQKQPRANILQYGPEQVKLVSILLYGIIFYAQQHFRLLIQVNFGTMSGNFPLMMTQAAKTQQN